MLNVAVVLAVALIAAQANHTHERPLVGGAPEASIAMSGPYQTLFRVEAPKIPVAQVLPVPVTDPKQMLGQVFEMAPRFQRGGCNMPVVAARPEMDPKMVIAVPDSTMAGAKIRVVEPPVSCGHR